MSIRLDNLLLLGLWHRVRSVQIVDFVGFRSWAETLAGVVEGLIKEI